MNVENSSLPSANYPWLLEDVNHHLDTGKIRLWCINRYDAPSKN